MLVAALLVIPVIAIEHSSAGEPWQGIAAVLNWAIWLAFAVEAVVMLTVVPSKLAWLRTHPLEVVVVLLTAPFLPPTLQAARALRLLRVLRLLRLALMARRVFTLEGLRYAAILAALTALGGGAAYASTEQAQDPPPSVWDGLWWAVSTMTTVGYGDEFPTTTLGRFVGMAVMLVGIGFIAVLTGAVAERFLEAKIEEEAVEAEQSEVTAEELLAELREIRMRLDRVDARLGRGAVDP